MTRIAQGAALMTDTQLEVDFVKGCSNIVPNNVLGKLAGDVLRSMEMPTYTEEEMELIKAIAVRRPC